MERVDHILEKNKLKKTSLRRRVLSLFIDKNGKAISNSELEDLLKDADRITLYRTIKSFQKKGIIHEAVDGTSSTKFALCHDECTEHSHVDNHAHFHCTKCGETSCLEHQPTPSYSLPDKYKVEDVILVVNGLCAECS